VQVKFSGSIHYANGDPISNVVVRIFDKDTAGKQDDDLTVIPGLSDEQGRFDLVYEPLRFLDYYAIQIPGLQKLPLNTDGRTSGLRMPDLGDVYLPYLQFNYTFNGHVCKHIASLGILQTDFHLPVNPPLEFLPSRSGFMFRNSFPGYFLPYTAPAFMRSRKISSTYGLCGGMCSAAYDYALAKRAIPQNVEAPYRGSRLHRYLFRRQLDSLGGLGQEVIKVAQWTSLPDDTLVGTQRRTADEFNPLHQKLDERNLVILAVIYEHASTVKELSRRIFNNHQVLAYAYQQDESGSVMINIYDPNLPGRDDVTIRSEPIVLGEVTSPSGSKTVVGLKSLQLVGGAFYKVIRGYFVLPYSPVQPPNATR
jgi:hypothetical protein